MACGGKAKKRLMNAFLPVALLLSVSIQIIYSRGKFYRYTANTLLETILACVC